MNFNNNQLTLLVLVVTLLPTTSLTAWAESNDKYDIAYASCLKKAETINNSVVHGCSELVSDSVKKDMNKLYDRIYKKISKQSNDDAEKFEQSQKSWLKYRKSHCELMGSYVGSPMYSFCPMTLNKSRVLELTQLAGG